jgi:hypothetical protein
VLAAALVSLLAGCSLGSNSDHKVAGLVVFRKHGITFTYPAGWRYSHRGFITTMTAPIADLGNQPLSDPCHGRDGCGFPIRQLKPGGVVMMVSSYADFSSTAKPGRTFRRYPGTPTGHHCDDLLVAN